MTPNRARLIELCDLLRTETRRDNRIARMITRLVEEAESAEQASARVAAAKAVVGYAVQAEQLAAEIETGDATGEGRSGVTVLVVNPAKADEGPRAPSPDEMSALLDELSASVRAERH